MTLHDCTKAELLEIFAVISRDAGTSWHINRALIDMENRRFNAKIDEAKRLIDLSNDKRREYNELLAPYDDKPLGSIPMYVLDKANQVAREIRAAEEKWCELMEVGNKK